MSQWKLQQDLLPSLLDRLTDLEPKAVPGPAVRRQVAELLEALRASKGPMA